MDAEFKADVSETLDMLVQGVITKDDALVEIERAASRRNQERKKGISAAKQLWAFLQASKHPKVRAQQNPA